MINVTNDPNENSTTPTENLKQQINTINDLENSEVTKKINKIKNEESSPLKPKRDDRSRSPSLSIKENKSENKSEKKIKSEKSEKSLNKSVNKSQISNSPKLIRKKTVIVDVKDAKKKLRVKFKNDFVQIVAVESYKKYNIDVSTNEGDYRESTKCRCLIF
jgi:hypothetical protein